MALVQRLWSRGATGTEVMGPAKDAALRAIAIDEGVALAHSVLAQIHQHFDVDPVRAQREHVRAMELKPQEPWVLRGYYFFLLSQDAFDEALELNARDLALDPTSPLANRFRAQALFVARRYDECVAQSHRTLSLDPRDLVLSHKWLAKCLEYQGKQREAVEMWERGRELRGGAHVAEQMKRIVRERGWMAYWRERLKTREFSFDAHASDEAAIDVRVGDLEKALGKLERLLDQRHPSLSSLNAPDWDPLRSHPRFQALRRRAGYGDEMNALLKASRPPLSQGR